MNLFKKTFLKCINMNPLFKKNDINLFKKYINQSKVYFEYGCGGSTYLASLCDNIQKIYTDNKKNSFLNLLLSMVVITIKQINIEKKSFN